MTHQLVREDHFLTDSRSRVIVTSSSAMSGRGARIVGSVLERGVLQPAISTPSGIAVATPRPQPLMSHMPRAQLPSLHPQPSTCVDKGKKGERGHHLHGRRRQRRLHLQQRHQSYCRQWHRLPKSLWPRPRSKYRPLLHPRLRHPPPSQSVKVLYPQNWVGVFRLTYHWRLGLGQASMPGRTLSRCLTMTPPWMKASSLPAGMCLHLHPMPQLSVTKGLRVRTAPHSWRN